MRSSKWLKLAYGLFLIVLSTGFEFQPFPEFARHTLIKPKIYHGRKSREISSSKEKEDSSKHLDHLALTISLNSKDVVLDLILNRDLISKNYFEKHQDESGYVLKYPQAHEIELCHYNGNIRGVENSWVAVSTCNGIRGTIFDGKEMHYIENIPVTSTNKLTDTHVIYSHSDLISNYSCGFPDSLHFHNADFNNHRIKRDTSVHGPYNANRLSRYIELVLVIDNQEFKALNEDTARVYQHCKDIANIVNSLYVPLNIFIALVGVVIWSRDDEITLEKNGDKTLTNFLAYRKDRLVKDHPNDNAQLLTKLQFNDGVVGKALKGPICTFEFSGGVNVDHSNAVGLVASTVAHEMGHNLGMEHDTSDCHCPSERCIMSPSSSSTSPTEWSSCSIDYLTMSFEHGMDYCLRNKPTSLFDGPVCGNGFVEPGEQCDCGLKEKCNNPCCDTSTCKLHVNASCATGECCDLKTCKPHSAGTVCRTADHECDLPEYCTGQSEYCPEDVFKVDGEECNKGTAFCYKGNCRSHSDQCRILWGPSGQSSDLQCYKQNMKGNRSGNCGYNRLNQAYIKCKEENAYCGMLQCKHFNERLEFGMESVAILSHSFISVNNSVIACRTAIVDLGLNEVDPGLAPDGAKCGENKMCLNQRCMEIDSLRAISTPGGCSHNCHGNGVCNSKGHCHCKVGFAPPDCEYPGPGGSEDSGPAVNPYSYNGLTTVFSLMLLGFIPLLLGLLLYSYYIRKSPSYFWKRNQRRTVHCEKSVQIHVSRNDNHGSHPNSTVQSLLPNNSKNPKSVEDGIVTASLQDNLIGSFKGFSITPIANGNATTTPIRPAPQTPSKLFINKTSALPNVPIAAIKPMRMAPTAPPVPSALRMAPKASPEVNETKTPPLLPPPNTPGRPSISSPVLDNTTSSTVKELIKKDLPVRPAPPAPVTKTRPTSTPVLDIRCEAENIKPNPKEQNLTLNRIASFITKSYRNEDKGVSLKAAKIDRDTLKSLKISDPIPLVEPSIPTVPVNTLPLSKDRDKNVVMRAQSLRQIKNKHAGIHSFGSMRLPDNRRPTSIPSCSRPTSPPPCPPPVQNHVNSKSYINYPVTKDAETDDNIYAVIEETPDEANIESPPKILNNSAGLLSEIVSEIQARNINSIYSADKNKLEVNDLPQDKSKLYENISGSSSSNNSGYLMPIKKDVGVKPTIGSSVKMKVPENSAPGYKPFSPSKKSIGSSSLQPKNKFSGENAKSSQKNKGSEKTDGKSQVSLTINKFNANDNTSVSTATKPTVIKPKPITGVMKPSTKTDTKSVKATSVASIQQKFEVQSKPSSKVGSSSKNDRSASNLRK